MKNNKFLLPIITVGLALGTAWAVRGRFGHEQGAAWAGAIGALCLILVARRKDWYNKAFRVAFAGAVGWGISGMMSYGAIVGYGRAPDFLNAFYGLLMLFVIGLLYGIIGGGLVGLALVDSRQQRVPWASLFAEMVAMALLTYGLLVNQLGWLMTPPRSELWACALGAGIALIWFAARNNYEHVLKMALWAAVGAGFGFALGNFIQVLGAGSGIRVNYWNVMEYLIGLGGGIGMAYGALTSSWSAAEEEVSPRTNVIPILFVALFVPFVVWEQSFVTEKMDAVVRAGGTETAIFVFKTIAIVGILALTLFALNRNFSQSLRQEQGKIVSQFFLLYMGLYILLSFLITGYVTHPLEQYLYVINLIAIAWLIREREPEVVVRPLRVGRWIVVTVASVAIIAILAFIAIHSHEGVGSNVRFVME